MDTQETEMRLLGVEPLKKIIKCAIVSPYIKNEKPFSLLIVAKAESGKTTAMKIFRKNKGILYITDTTAWGLQREHLTDLEKGDIKTIMMPDLITPLSKSTKTRKSFIAFLNNLIEEGVCRIEHYAMRYITDVDVKANVITAITREELNDGRREWAKMGFLSRFIVFTYKYSMKNVIHILDEISRSDLDTSRVEEEKIELPEEEVDIFLPKEIADKLNTVAMQIGALQKLYGIRAKINLRSLIKCIAYLNGRKEVTLEDYEELLELVTYMNLDYNIIR